DRRCPGVSLNDGGTSMNRSARRHRDTLLSGRVSRRALIQGTTAGAIAATRIGQASAQVDATPVASPVMYPVSPPARFATSPQHGSRTASTDTTISFRGLDRRDLGEVRRSEEHTSELQSREKL